TRGLRGTEPVDYEAMAEAGTRLFSDDGIPIDDQALLARAFDEVNCLGFAISLHEEDRALSKDGVLNEGAVAESLGVSGMPAAAEISRIRRDLAIALGTEAAVHIAHLSTAESVELVRSARKRGAIVTCEVTPHHFTADESLALIWGPNAKMNPPLRSAADVEAIRAAIADGSIDMIATDHAPHDPDAKQMHLLAPHFGPEHKPERLSDELASTFEHSANGIVGLETALGLAMELVHRSLISPSRMVEMMSLKPAGLLRVEAGKLTRGARADITVIDPEFRWTVEPAKFLSKSRNTPFAGRELRGKAALTIVGAGIVYDGRRAEQR
ncbi:MAG TPA: dihydroorotase, partial [Candidatus Binataceae bacterium]